MTKAPAPGPWTTWWLEPRDPLVFGDGARVPALVPRHAGWLPPQTTAAGFVRSRFVAGKSSVSPEEARGLLDISLRGPWLVEVKGSGPSALWVPVPADLALGGSGSEEVRLGGRVLSLTPDEGVNWPSGTPEGLVPCHVPEKHLGQKTRRPDFPFLPLEDLLAWRLGESTGPESDARWVPCPEYRVHVQLDDDAGTAEPEALFSSGGIRYPEAFRLVLEVEDGRPEADVNRAPGPGDPPHLAVVGAEARASRLRLSAGPLFPGFTAFERRYELAIERWRREGRPLALRVQLLRPGDFGGWEPAWPGSLHAPLLSVALGRFAAVSGWNLQRRGPRKVRRLAPAGSVYLLGPYPSPEALLADCRELWGRSLCESRSGDPKEHLAPPARDGYGTALPIPCPLPPEAP